ncbi:V-type ATP synthase subunit I [bacterium]|nr:V-type ATP synthase subunit I [bacterium]
MAVAQMKKIGIIFLSNESEQIVDYLHTQGVIQIETPEEGEPLPKIDELEKKIRRINWAISFLEQFSEKPKPPAIKEKEKYVDERKLDSILEEIETASGRLERLDGNIKSLEAKKAHIEKWSGMDAPLKLIQDTEFVRMKLGLVPAFTTKIFETEKKNLPLLYTETISHHHEGDYCFLLYHRSQEEEVKQLLHRVELVEHKFDEFEGRIDNIKEHLTQKIEKLTAEKEALVNGIKAKLPAIRELLIALDQYTILLEQATVISKARKTAKTKILTGWIREDEFAEFKEKTASLFPSSEIIEIAPKEGEEPPVALKNPEVLKPVEVVTSLYGYPSPGMIDPTPLVALFFPLFFGIAITDAGYGLVLSLAGITGAILFRKDPGAKRLMKLIAYGGFFAILAGIATGGYFGMNASEINIPILKTLKLFDPLQDAMVFFSIVIILGAIQLSVGFLAGMYVKLLHLKSIVRKIRTIVVSLSWVAISLGAGAAMISFLLPDVIKPYAAIYTNMLFYGVLGMLFGNLILGIASGEGVGKSVYEALGFDGLYAIIGLFGDILSYSRLLALGLATGVIANVIDIIAKTVSGIPVIGILIAVLILLLGHTAYIGLSAISAFVHPARLQFVEFFTKFYEGGGKVFKPFKKEYRNIVITD